MEIYVFIIYQETPGRMAFSLQSEITLLWQVSVRSAGESLQILLHCKHHQVKFCSERHKKQSLNVALLIPGDIPAAFVHIPKKHVSPQNIYQDFSFFLIFPRKASHSQWYPAHGFGCSPFHSCMEREAEYGGVVSNKKQRTLQGQHW